MDLYSLLFQKRGKKRTNKKGQKVGEKNAGIKSQSFHFGDQRQKNNGVVKYNSNHTHGFVIITFSFGIFNIKCTKEEI